MSWITVFWSMLASASLTFAFLPLFFWAKGIQTSANLSFAVAALSVAMITGMELLAMRATSIEQMSTLLRWVHLPILILWAGIICFVRFSFDAGRSWLAWTGGILRLVALILSFTTGQNLFFKEITGLKHVGMGGGETIVLPQGILNPWYVVGPLSTLVLAAFVLDAAVTLWRRETNTGRRRAVLFSGSILFFLLTAAVHALLVNIGVINSPYIVGLSFVPILLAMSYELSCDMLQSVQIAEQLRAREAELSINKQRIKLAASAANLRLWEWDIVHDQIWSTDKSRTLYGLSDSQKISFDSFLNILYDEDRKRVSLEVAKALAGDGNFECEYRIKMPDGRLHWFNSRGRSEFDEDKQPLRMLGVTIDITRRKQMELEMQKLRTEMTHLSRVTMLGELSGSLAHELNQPLTSILSNAQAAQRFLARGQAGLEEVRNILDDIVAEDRRASDIIQRLRALLKKGEMQLLPLDLNKIVKDVLKLVNSDLVNHNVTVDVHLDRNLPAVIGDRVQLQQVILNLIMNGCEAMSHAKTKERRLSIGTALIGADQVQVSVADQGTGIPYESMKSVFEPFYTSKPHGLGLGLPICRTIINAHDGKIWAANNSSTGAIFYITLPVHHGENA
jgi:two-component system sensor kinase FixL